MRKNGEQFDVELRYLPIVHRGEPHVLAVGARHHRAPPGRGRARRARGAAAPGAEDGGDRPAHRRHRARLQQHPDQRHRLPGDGRGARGAARRRAPGAPARAGPCGGAARARPDRADADLRAPPARRAARARIAGAGAAQPCNCCARPCRRRSSSTPTPTMPRRRCKPMRCSSSRCCSTCASTRATPSATAAAHRACAAAPERGRGLPLRVVPCAAWPTGAGSSCAWPTAAAASRPRCWSACSIRSTRPRRSAAARAWGWRWCTASCTTMAGTCASRRGPAPARAFACCCREPRRRRADPAAANAGVAGPCTRCAAACCWSRTRRWSAS